MSTELKRRGRPPKERTLSTESTQAAPADLISMFQQMLAQQAESSRDLVIAAITEMKKPSAEEAEKIAAEKTRQLQRTMSRVNRAKKRETDDALLQAGCAHQMPNGATNLRGQVHSNGYAKAYCSHCHYLSQYFKATDIERTSGLNLNQWGGNAMYYVKQRILSSEPPPPAPDIPAGATIIFG